MILLAFSKTDWVTLVNSFLKISIALSKIDWTTFIDWFLRILQIITFLGVIIKISFKNEDYIDNVEINSITPMQFDPLHNRFHFINEFNHTSNTESTNHFLFYPKGTDIKKLNFYSLTFRKKGFKKKKIHSINNLRNNTCLVIHTNVPGTIPNLSMKWETSSGEVGEYIFHNNGYNGNTNISDYKPKLTLKRKLLLILSL